MVTDKTWDISGVEVNVMDLSLTKKLTRRMATANKTCVSGKN